MLNHPECFTSERKRPSTGDNMHNRPECITLERKRPNTGELTRANANDNLTNVPLTNESTPGPLDK